METDEIKRPNITIEIFKAYADAGRKWFEPQPKFDTAPPKEPTACYVFKMDKQHIEALERLYGTDVESIIESMVAEELCEELFKETESVWLEGEGGIQGKPIGILPSSLVSKVEDNDKTKRKA